MWILLDDNHDNEYCVIWQDNVAFFSFPFDAEMFYKRPATDEDGDGKEMMDT